MCLLALIGRASYLIFVHRLTVSFHASFPRSVTLAQLRFPSLTVVSSREDFHLQDRAHAGRTHPPRPEGRGFGIGFDEPRQIMQALGDRRPHETQPPKLVFYTQTSSTFPLRGRLKDLAPIF